MDRTFGIELEVGGVKTLKLAEFVYDLQELDYSKWKDRGRNSKNREYTAWNVQSDPTIQNYDGTMCMYDVLVDGELKNIGTDKELKKLQLGAEIISPVYKISEYEEFEKTLTTIVDFVVSEGGYVSPKLDHELHIHIGIEDYELQNVKQLLVWFYEHGEKFFEKYPGYHDRYSKNRVLFDWQVEEIKGTTKASALWELYKVSYKNGKKSELEWTYRKDVNPAHWLENKVLKWDRPLTTEFRPIASTLDLKLLKKIVHDCFEIVETLA